MPNPQLPLPKVTIGIPTRDRREYVALAIESALAQTYAGIEVVVSDNQSNDDTPFYLTSIRDPRLVALRQERNIGMIGNFNACLGAATGEFFLLLSDDDILEPTAIEKLIAPFLDSTSASPHQIGVSWCPCRIIDSAGNVKWETAAGPAVESSVSFIVELFAGNRGPRLASVLQRTADLREIGGYSEDFGDLCDTGAWGQVALKYATAASTPAHLVSYRVHAAAGTGAAKCAAWQAAGHRMLDAFVRAAHGHADRKHVRRLERSRKNLLANLTVDVLMRSKGQPGWVGAFCAEFWRSRSFMLTPFVFTRCLKDGWKLLRPA